MEPLQLIAHEASRHALPHVRDALPNAPQVPYEPREHPTRARLAALLRRTADRVDPCPCPCPAPG